MGIFLVIIPISIFLTVGGAIAIGLVGTVFGKHDDRTKMERFWAKFLKGWIMLVCGVWLLPWIVYGGIVLMNETAPATLARTTLSNGEKTVVFQSMMHIASPGFYEDIKKDMEQLV